MSEEEQSLDGIQVTEEHIKTLKAILNSMEKIKMDQEAVKEDKKALADKMGVKPNIINKITSIMKKEQEEGGAIRMERNTLDLTEQALKYTDDEE